MIGIENIGIWFPENFESNYDLKEKFEIDDYFIEEKIGVRKVARISKEQQASDMCIGAYEDLVKRVGQVAGIDILVVVTQNPDSNIPHVSAKIHGVLGLQTACACFDISLGCSGFVYALSIVEAMMLANGFKKALLFTADPYSKIVEEEDKNTRLLFGDGAAVSLVSENPVWQTGKFSFGTLGHLHGDLTCTNAKLFMNGRGIFDFAARNIPGDIIKVLKENNLVKEDIDLFIVHQGSKYMLDTLAKKLGITADKIPFKASQYGNTVSSSIPIILQQYIDEPSVKKILISGFGVGLSYASTVLFRN
jgi:3-oxoacyl-[acyl-carrier-protein] synthase-3